MRRLLLTAITLLMPASLTAAEAIWIEAEHLDGIKGFCWPMGKPEMKKTAGHWALSGPGWAAEWNQGGESGFLSIATGADDDRAVATKTIDIPADGTYFVWVRYGDWREQSERFQVQIEQDGKSWTGRYGERALIDEDNEMKLYWGWAFAWDKGQAKLQKGPAKLSLLATTKEAEPRQIDAIVLTTDETYQPRIKERPRNPAWDLLQQYRKGGQAGLEPLARSRPEYQLPESWQQRTFTFAFRTYHKRRNLRLRSQEEERELVGAFCRLSGMLIVDAKDGSMKVFHSEEDEEKDFLRECFEHPEGWAEEVERSQSLLSQRRWEDPSLPDWPM